MICPNCQGMIVKEELSVDGCLIDDIYCVNCGERFYPDGVDRGMKLRETAINELFNNFNNLAKRYNAF